MGCISKNLPISLKFSTLVECRFSVRPHGFLSFFDTCSQGPGRAGAEVSSLERRKKRDLLFNRQYKVLGKAIYVHFLAQIGPIEVICSIAKKAQPQHLG